MLQLKNYTLLKIYNYKILLIFSLYIIKNL